jgi:Glucose dehydrogenase C-terminus
VTTGPKPDLVTDLGGTYHSGTVADAVGHADVVVECTGVGELVLDAVDKTGPDGIVCLAGVSAAGRRLTIDAGALNRELVLENEVVFGTVTPTAATTRQPRPPWPTPTKPGWNASSPAGSPSTTGRTPSSDAPTTSKRSSTSAADRRLRLRPPR